MNGGSPPLTVEEARRIVIEAAQPSGSEPLALPDCAGRVTASAVRAQAPVPAFDSSAMDGFAVRSADAAGASVSLTVVDESRAGHPARHDPGPGEAVRISTGAMVPAGADAVVPLEHVVEDGGRVHLGPEPVPSGAHVRRAGGDLAGDSVAIATGTVLGAAELGVLASLGVAEVECARKPALAVLTSGDELLAPGQAAGPGQIYDASRVSLPAMAREAGAEGFHAGVLADDPAAIVAGVEEALAADLVVIAGGVSVGPHDHVKDALAELGIEQLFWRVALKPGGPMWFGVHRRPGEGKKSLVFGLPGNPVSSMVTFHLFARAAILAALGSDPDADRGSAILAEDYRKAPGRAHYLRCRLGLDERGWVASPTTSRQGSHVLSSMLGASCLAVIPAERSAVDAGERVEIRLL